MSIQERELSIAGEDRARKIFLFTEERFSIPRTVLLIFMKIGNYLFSFIIEKCPIMDRAMLYILL
jgi:hypothetical protein